MAWRRGWGGRAWWDGREHGLVSGKQESEQAVLENVERYYGIEMVVVCGCRRSVGVAMGKDEMHVQEAKEGAECRRNPEMRDGQNGNGYVQAGARGGRRVF